MARKKSPEAGLSAEVRFHIEKLAEVYVAAGMDPAEAERRARREFGGVEQIKEECRDVRGRWIEDLGKDLSYTLRTLRRSPGFLAVAVLSLALGIGANTAIFSLINAVMLRSVPVREPERLVHITRVTQNNMPRLVSYWLFEYFRDNMKSISAAAAQMQSAQFILMDGIEEYVYPELVSGAHFSVLGIQPAAGRLLQPEDDVIDPASPAAVISYAYWQRRFGLDPAAIGKTFRINRLNRVFTIVGVTPPGYRGIRTGEDPPVTLPLAMMLSSNHRSEVTSNMLDMTARLKPGATLEAANAEVQVLWNSFIQERASQAAVKDRPSILKERAAALPVSTGLNRIRWDYSDALLVLMGIVGLVLLLACANLSSLLLARAASRQREISIRLAIGAGRGRLLRQFLTESLVLAVLGGAGGLLLAHWFSGALVAMIANGRSLTLSISPDWRVLAFTGAVSLASCILAGLAPGLHAIRASINPALKEVRAGGHRRIGKALVVAQLGISMVLLVGATLFLGTLIKLHSIDRGVRTEGVLAFRVRANRQYPPARGLALQNDLLARLGALPGVSLASASQVLPVSGGIWTRRVQVEGYTFRPDESEDAGFNAIAPKYFATIGTPLLLGREFDARDSGTAKKVAILNESFARYFFGAQSAIGRRVTSVNVTYEIVGVVKDAKYQNLRDGIMKTMYIPWMQREGDHAERGTYLARVAAGDPMRLAPLLERMVREADPGLHLLDAKTYDYIIDQTIVTERIMATLGGFFGLLALIVACLGMFGIMAFQVSRRVNELGVRMALGASRGGIIKLVLKDVALMWIAGSVVGCAGALTLTHLAGRMLFGVTPTDPAVFGLSAAVLAVATFAAAWLPARRASRIDPLAAVRHE